MNFSYYIAKRYIRSKSNNNAINFITIIAIIGIVLGAASLFIVLSGFAGLKDFTLEFSTVIDPDLKAETTIGKSFVLSEDLENSLKKIEGIASYSKIIEERVFASFDGKPHPAYIKGVDENYEKIIAVDSILMQGSWITQNTRQIVVGWGISNSLSLGVLDYGKAVNLYVPKPGKGQITSAKQAFKELSVVNVGVFDINENLNDNYIYSPIAVAEELLSFSPNQITYIEFKLKNGVDEALVKSQIQSVLGENIIVKNRTQLNDSLNKMLNTENLAVYLIFTLVLIIAFFNVIGSLIMMMLDKKQSLNTLFNIGATVKDIRKIFLLQGVLISVIGGIIGLLISLALVFLQKTFSLVMITPSLAYPVTIKVENLFIVFVTITVLGLIASKIASSRITDELVKTS